MDDEFNFIVMLVEQRVSFLSLKSFKLIIKLITIVLIIYLAINSFTSFPPKTVYLFDSIRSNN